MKLEYVLFPSVFFKITDPFDGRSFLRSTGSIASGSFQIHFSPKPLKM